MSIINDALKKVQQQQASKAGGGAAPNGDPPVEYLTPPKSKLKPVLAFICAMAITAGALIFLYKQVNTYFPNLREKIKSTYYKLIHKKEIPAFKAKSPAELVPLAKITVAAPQPAPAEAPAQAGVPAPAVPAAATGMVKGPPGVTLNIHGVMSEGPSNVVLIDDQVYQEGDEVDGVKIVKIGLDAITVINNGRQETIRVNH